MSAKRSISNSNRLQLEDIEAIKILKARYGYYCDDSYDPDGISSLFVEDGVWDGGQFGRYEGRSAIHDFFRDLARDKIGFAMHLFMNPLIEVSGDTKAIKRPGAQAATSRNMSNWMASGSTSCFVSRPILLPLLTKAGQKRNLYSDHVDI